MWALSRTEDRRNSASVVELRRAAKLAQSRLADGSQSPGLRRANSCKESDGQVSRPPSYLKPPYPDYYDPEFRHLGGSVSGSDEIKLHKTKSKNSPMASPRMGRRASEQKMSSSLNHIQINNGKYLKHSRSIKDLRNCEVPGNSEENCTESDRKSRNSGNGNGSPRGMSLTGIPEDIKIDKHLTVDEVSSLFGANEKCYQTCDYHFKVMLLGDTGVGKTCLVTKFRDGIFLSGNFIATVGIDYRNKTISLEDGKVHLQIWDTAGQERFRSLTRSYYRVAQALLLMYDVQNRDSFNSTRSWLTELHQMARPEVVILLIGNKCDLPESARAVTRQEGEDLARELNVTFLETSAKLGTNVELTFTAVARQLRSLHSSDQNEKNFCVQDYVNSHDEGNGAFCSMCRIC